MKRIFTFLVLLAAFPLSARADMIWSDAYKNPFSDWGAYMYDQNVKRHLREGAVKGKSSTGQATNPSNPATPAAPALPTAPITATDFTRDPKGKDVVDQFITAAKVAPAEGTQLATALRSTMTQLGAAGRKDNVATVMTLLIGLSYGVIEKPGFDVARADDLVPMINNALAASPQFTSLGAPDRQNMYDSMLLSAAVIAIVHQSGDKQASQTIAKQTLQQLGLPSE
ncbi:MAG TPA: DUF6683 family protein [bacterium]|nr:DUF6683 family protein [bacterium]